MPEYLCPICHSPCIIKVIATDSEKWCEVDVCKICGTMYPRDTPLKKPKAVKKPKKKAAKAKPRPKKAVKKKRSKK